MQDHALFFGASLEQSSLLRRLFEQFIEASREFRQHPRQFILSSIKGDGLGGRRRQQFLQYGLAISLLIYSTFFLATLAFWTIAHRHDATTSYSDNGLIPTQLYLPPYQHEANLRKDDKEKENHGGGGGGDHSSTPATQGERPDFAFENPLMAPTTRPTLSPPNLPMTETLLGDPAQNLKRDNLAPTGLPEGVIGPPSDGQGSGKGLGAGEKGGVGSGKGQGFRLGEDGGQNDGKRQDGTARRDRPYDNEAVDSKPVALNKPRPNYTEQARREKVQGMVHARILIGADGLVKQVKISGVGLTGGLNEEAIQAAKQMRFQPAMKNGQAVSYWVTVEIEFNLR
ncbi:MAG: energy transducer TonB [Acidobacteria bacterium]|nr:energy transducer TonB [Acidobacteriota bacterium]